MDKIKQLWLSMSGIQQIITLVALSVLVWLIVTKAKAYLSAISTNINQKTEIQVLENLGMKLSYSKIEYLTIAENLDVAMRGLGTDEIAIISELEKIKNDLDFIQLNSAFGLRSASFSNPSNLSNWLMSDLGTTIVQQINIQLKNKGLKKQF
jgi:hypothetical protein